MGWKKLRGNPFAGPHEKPPVISGPTKLVSIPLLGGLHHRYVRVAA